MLFDDSYNTVRAAAEGVFKDRGSRFVGLIFPLKSEVEFKNHYQELKRIHAKANHHCYAWRLSPARNIYKINDDREPSGTAGRPILNQLLVCDLTDCALVVVRYFGGVLLGVPGLINAYKQAAAAAIANSEIVNCEILLKYRIEFDYELMNDIMKKLKFNKANIISQTNDSNCLIEFSVARKYENILLDEIHNNYNLTDKVKITNI